MMPVTMYDAYDYVTEQLVLEYIRSDNGYEQHFH